MSASSVFGGIEDESSFSVTDGLSQNEVDAQLMKHVDLLNDLKEIGLDASVDSLA